MKLVVPVILSLVATAIAVLVVSTLARGSGLGGLDRPDEPVTEVTS